ncbi:MAG: DegT/DnrJ/EryC1/StrS aminotransferase family protein [archaeon]|nr:DegT/DnrJ/EryC1/StrS aminotransferase family protein [archaeon]
MKFYPENNIDINKTDIDEVLNVMKNKEISVYNSDIVKKYEQFFALKSGVKYAMATNNGTAALHTILTALEISNRDEVFISGLNYISDIYAILYLKSKPIILDIDLETLMISIEEIKKRINNKTKAIVLTGNYGLPTNAYEIKKIVKNKKIFVIEDLSQCFGSKYKNNPYGIRGDIGFYSTSSTKNLTTGEGGMIVTNNKKLAEKCKVFLNLGQVYKNTQQAVYPSFDFSKKIDHIAVGFTYRMSSILSAIGISQLKRTAISCEKRRNICLLYKSIVSKYSFIKIPKYSNKFIPCFNEFPILVDLSRKDMKKIIMEFKKSNLPIYPSYYSELLTYSSVKEYCCIESVKNIKYFSEHNLILPVNINSTKKQMNDLVKIVSNIFKKYDHIRSIRIK